MYIEGKLYQGIEGFKHIKKIIVDNGENIEYMHPDRNINNWMENTVDQSVHVILKEGDAAIGCGSLILSQGDCYLEHIFVTAGQRRKKYGDFAVRILLDRAFQSQHEEVFVYCREQDKPFFMSIGFRDCREREKSDFVSKVVKLGIKADFVCRECKSMR